MIRKFTSLLAAVIVALATLAPAAADARDRRGHGYYDGGRHGGYYDGRRRWRDRDNDDEIAAGVVGLVLGLAIGSMASQSGRRDGCYDNYRCAPPPPPRRCYDPCGRDGYYDQGYDPYYGDRRAPYEDDYYDRDAYREPQCTRRERQWDRYANRYVTVDVPC
ncbi:MAG: hypothetical protein AB7H66_12080 [Hyphomonadaceae bacterium]